ncbi:T-complex protein 11-like protein 1 [Eumeta japonica]|uniref:T-complex protein 11-like protein 1 n=1 Tax=Eumeta variegata TaxID=151549 RepID=A0A4C1VVB9_EUMVA|nr:T-complex protein 11-like protein 1 [Eumeta japonica]
MSDPKEGPSGIDPKNKEGTKNGARSSSQLIPTSTSGPHYINEHLQFRVRGSTITGASPPKFVSLEEIMQAAHGFQNMALAHEIAVGHDFKLEPFEPPDNSYQKLVKETMHKAYFDILREQLNSDPPEYKQAFILMEDIKQGLFSILLPRHTRIKQMIEEVLDGEFIKQQAENNSLDFHKYAVFVIDLMAKLAAPARDEMIQNITKLTDTVDIFRAILEALEVLKLDLANTLIAMIRPHVQAESVQYEREKFDEMLKIQEDGLEHTRAWIKNHIDKTGLTLPVTDNNIIRNVTAQTLAKAFLDLLEWDDAKPYPETVSLDAVRFAELASQLYRVVCIAAIMLVSPACGAPDAAEHKKQLKENIIIILGNTSTDVELAAALPSVAEEVIASTDKLLQRLEQSPLASDVKELVRTQLAALADSQHRVRQIVHERVVQFLQAVLVCGGGSRPVPAGLSALATELTTLAGALLRYVMHNKAVFMHHYQRIVEEELAQT